MCSPTLLIMSAAAIQGFMQYQQGQAAAEATKVTAANNAKVADYNANIQDKAAADAVARGAEDAATQKRAAMVANGTLRAESGSTGFLADTGTPLNLQGQNTGTGELNALTVTNNAEREAYGYKQNATAIRFGAQANSANADYQAKVQSQNGLLQGLGTFVTGAATAGTNAGWFSTPAKVAKTSGYVGYGSYAGGY